MGKVLDYATRDGHRSRQRGLAWSSFTLFFVGIFLAVVPILVDLHVNTRGTFLAVCLGFIAGGGSFIVGALLGAASFIKRRQGRFAAIASLLNIAGFIAELSVFFH